MTDNKASSWVLTAAAAAAMGALAMLITVLFLKVLEAAIKLVWTTIPEQLNIDSRTWYYLVPVTVVGGAVIGLFRQRFGEYPLALEESVDEFRVTKEFDYHHLLQGGTLGLICLAVGASLGPEAVLISLAGGLSSWVASRIKTNALQRDTIAALGLAGAFGVLFGSAGAAAFAVPEPAPAAGDESLADAVVRRAKVVWLVIPGVLAAAGAAWVFRHFPGGGAGYFDIDFPDYTFAVGDLAKCLLPAVAGLVIAWVMVALLAACTAAIDRITRQPVVQSITGGVGLAGLALVSAYAQFSGHASVQKVIDAARDGTTTAGALSIDALVKVLAASICLAGLWKGGKFFPIMFAGAAAGLAVSLAVPSVPLALGVVCGMTAGLGALLRKPVAAIVFLLLFVTGEPSLVPAVILSGLIGGGVTKRLAPRFPVLWPDPPTVEVAADGASS